MPDQQGSTRDGEVTPDSDPSPEAGTTKPPELTLDELLELVQNERRRRIVQYLPRGDGAVAVGDLADHLATQEYDCPPTGPSSVQQKRMYVSLYQSHLPKMDEMDVVAFDKDRGEVKPGPHARRVTQFVERVSGDDPAWPLYYLGETALAAVLVVVSLYSPAGTELASMLLDVVVGLLVLTNVLHLYWWRGDQLRD